MCSHSVPSILSECQVFMFESSSRCYFLFYFEGLWLLMLCIVLLPFCHLVRLVSVVLISVSSPFVVWYLCIYCLSLHVYFVVSSVVLCRIFLHVCVSVHSVFSCKVHRVRCLVHGLLIFCVLWELSFNAAFWGYSCLSIPASRSTSLLSFHDNFFTFLKTTLHSTCAPAISKCFLLCTLLVVAKKITFANYWGNSICLILFCKKPKKKKKEKKDHLCKRPAESSERLLFGWIYCLAERQRPLRVLLARRPLGSPWAHCMMTLFRAVLLCLLMKLLLTCKMVMTRSF